MKTEKTSSNDDLSKCTLFVRGIPTSCSNEDLSEVFSQAGPIKDCFVVKYKASPKNTAERPRIGYVTYVSPDDAKSAVKREFTIDDENLKISFAIKKKFSKKNQKKPDFEIVKIDDTTTKSATVEDAEEAQSSSVTPEQAQDHNLPDTFTVFVSGVPGLYKKDHALGMWKKCGLKEPIDIIMGCEDVETETAENVTKDPTIHLQNVKFVVENKQAALKACNKLAGRAVGKKKNYKIKATLLTPEGDFKAARKSRLIIRNVSFQCSEEDLRKAFDLYGTVTDVKIPTKPNGLKRGFAFVQFTHVFEAARAIKAMNMKEIKGRKVAIDWSLPKEKYQELSETVESTGEKSEEKADDSEMSDDDGSEGLSDDSGMEDAESDESESNKETDSEEDESENEENAYEKPLEKAAKNVKQHDKKSSHDVHEGKTVFIMNLSYDTSEEQLFETLSEHGKLNYAKIVINQDTGMSKGCGFAQFSTLKEADECITKFGGESSELLVDGRPVKVVKAMSRGDTDKMKKDEKKSKKKEKEDKRNLYLGREGLVRPGTQAAEGLSQIELKKRERIENAKRSKLRNPNIFVSKTRLCVHNIPKSVDEAKLRELALNQLKSEKHVRITECRIMRDMKNLNESGVGRSLGFAFVNFTKHENALKTLRSLNNNPDIFGPLKRPIVEFALENKKALEIKEQRKKKYVAKMKLKDKIHNSADTDSHRDDKKVKKIGRRERQKQRRRLENTSVQESEAGDTNKQNHGKRAWQNRETSQSASTPPSIMQKNRDDGETGTGVKQSKRFKKNFKKEQPQKDDTVQERKSFQGSTGTTLSGKKLPMPAHPGPKIRQKNKGRVVEQMRRSKKLNSKAAQRKVMQKYNQEKNPTAKAFNKKPVTKKETPQSSTRKRKRPMNEDAEFNALVAKYTKAIMDKTQQSKKTGTKWFE